MQRRLQLIIVAHVWVLAPFALIWLSLPAWRGNAPQVAVTALTALAAVTFMYLLLRTWLTLRWQWPEASLIWPYFDVALVTTALVAVGNPQDALSILYFIPITSAVASLRLANLISLAGVAVAAYAGVIFVTHTPLAVPVAFHLGIIAIIASLYGWIVRTVSIYERAAERAEYQTELAREVHDGIQHLLVTLGIRLELADRLIPEDPQRAAAIVRQERETATRAGDELRYLVRRLRAGPQHADLPTALRAQVATLSDRWPFILDVDIQPSLPRLTPAAEHAMVRVIQESLTNAAKHARASQVAVAVTVADGAVQCTIHDDGEGFDPAVASGGLQGLRERVAAAGGAFQVASDADRGTTITASWPVPRRAL
ncbi:MAG TPA: sensor histidine kinase [bacterium]|jgi:signal transduction histidine kinase